MKWTPLDFVVAFIAFGFTAVMLTPIVVTLSMGGTLSDHGLDTLEELCMGALAIVSLYVGASLQRRRDQEKDD